MLTIIKRIPDHRGRVRWLCKCDCGNTTTVLTSKLNTGDKKSCGCLYRSKKSVTKHGHSGERIHRTWKNMYSRCYNHNNKSYVDYGARGIKICDEWRGEHGFENFYNWAMSHGYSDTLTIERVDFNKNYCPSNCTWITKKEQSRNKRNSHFVSINGEAKTLGEWAEISGLNSTTISSRIKRGWSEDKLLAPPNSIRRGGGIKR